MKSLDLKIQLAVDSNVAAFRVLLEHLEGAAQRHDLGAVVIVATRLTDLAEDLWHEVTPSALGDIKIPAPTEPPTTTEPIIEIPEAAEPSVESEEPEKLDVRPAGGQDYASLEIAARALDVARRASGFSGDLLCAAAPTRTEIRDYGLEALRAGLIVASGDRFALARPGPAPALDVVDLGGEATDDIEEEQGVDVDEEGARETLLGRRDDDLAYLAELIATAKGLDTTGLVHDPDLGAQKYLPFAGYGAACLRAGLIEDGEGPGGPDAGGRYVILSTVPVDPAGPPIPACDTREPRAWEADIACSSCPAHFAVPCGAAPGGQVCAEQVKRWHAEFEAGPIPEDPWDVFLARHKMDRADTGVDTFFAWAPGYLMMDADACTIGDIENAWIARKAEARALGTAHAREINAEKSPTQSAAARQGHAQLCMHRGQESRDWCHLLDDRCDPEAPLCTGPTPMETERSCRKCPAGFSTTCGAVPGTDRCRAAVGAHDRDLVRARTIAAESREKCAPLASTAKKETKGMSARTRRDHERSCEDFRRRWIAERSRDGALALDVEHALVLAHPLHFVLGHDGADAGLAVLTSAAKRGLAYFSRGSDQARVLADPDE